MWKICVPFLKAEPVLLLRLYDKFTVLYHERPILETSICFWIRNVQMNHVVCEEEFRCKQRQTDDFSAVLGCWLKVEYLWVTSNADVLERLSNFLRITLNHNLGLVSSIKVKSTCTHCQYPPGILKIQNVSCCKVLIPWCLCVSLATLCGNAF